MSWRGLMRLRVRLCEVRGFPGPQMRGTWGTQISITLKVSALERGDNLIGRAYAAHSGKDALHAVGMAFARRAGHRILGKNQLVAAFVGVARRALHAELGGDAADHNRREAATAELQVEIGAVERAPLALQNHNVARLLIELGNQLTPIRRERAK